MNFAHPIWLVIGILACAALAFLYRRYDRAQRAALGQFASARLLPSLTTTVSPARRRVKRGLFIVGTFFLFVALARPQVGYVWQETHRKGIELLFAIDTSKSMLAQDIKPDRLTRAKLAVTDLVEKLDGDGVGLVAFSGNAFLQCPVTLDYNAFRDSLNALDAGIIPRGGTDIAAAIHEAQAVFKTRTTAEKILVLITDGEDLGGEGIAAAKAAAADGVKIFTVGVGGTSGELIPVATANGGTDFARDASGELVRSSLDETTLQEIAATAGGIYQPLGVQGEGLTNIYDDGLSQFAREELSARQNKVPLERMQWALAAALACFLAEFLIGNRRRKPRAVSAPASASSAAAVAVLALVTFTPDAPAAAPQDAEAAYHEGDFASSQADYAAAIAKKPEDPRLHFNAGAAAYKAGDFNAAQVAFEDSIGTGDVAVQQDSYYNLGNTQFRLGQATEAENPQETIKTWEEAVESYDAALEINPEDKAAQTNRDLVQSKIDELKKQEEQKQDDQKDDQQEQDKKDQQDQQNQQDQQDQQDQQNQQDQQGKTTRHQKAQQDQKDQQGEQDKQDQEKQNGDSESKPDQSQGDSEKDESSEGKAGDKQQDGEQDKSDASDKSQEPKEQEGDAGEKPGEQKPEQGEEAGDKPAQPKPVNPGEKPATGQPEPANGKAGEQSPGSAAPGQRREPGGMTPEEAAQLLDALEGEERQLPAISAQGRAGGRPQPPKNLKDW